VLKRFPILLAPKTSSFRLSEGFPSIKILLSKDARVPINPASVGSFMDFYQARNELRRMSRRYLLSLASTQRVSKCFLGVRACCLHLHYKGFNFCVSEIMGEGCQVERSAKLEEVYQSQDEISCRPLPLMDRIGINLLSPGKKAVEFKVYCRDPIKKSVIFLGNILERRTKERRNNLRDLLVKAVKDYSYCIEGASTIFLLGS